MGVSFNTLNNCINVKFPLENTSFLDKQNTAKTILNILHYACVSFTRGKPPIETLGNLHCAAKLP